MRKSMLGKTGLEVTELCFGALPMGPLQAKLPEDKGALLIVEALRAGINFIDTAEMYQTYPYIKKALANFSGEVIVATKSFAESYEDMEASIKKALGEMGISYIDIFHLHAAKAVSDVFEKRAGALQCLKDYKAKGIVRHIGISTHSVEVVNAAAEIDDIDIVFPIINMIGMGIIAGSKEEMLAAIEKVHQSGKGIYAMKALAGGHLIDKMQDAFEYVRKIPGISSVAVGMVSSDELALNMKIFNNEIISKVEFPQNMKSNKSIIISLFCKGCGTCVDACPNSALEIKNDKAVVDKSLCLLCGYCNPACPEFAIRLA